MGEGILVANAIDRLTASRRVGGSTVYLDELTVAISKLTECIKTMGPIGDSKMQVFELIQKLETKAASRTEALKDIAYAVGVEWREGDKKDDDKTRTEMVELSIRDTVVGVEQLIGVHQTVRADRDEWQRKYMLLATVGWKINPLPTVIGFGLGVMAMVIVRMLWH
jgi:hypothetical protein